ncbi:hypothetical protein ACQ4PT_048990 [Festuca glaucescens]
MLRAGRKFQDIDGRCRFQPPRFAAIPGVMGQQFIRRGRTEYTRGLWFRDATGSTAIEEEDVYIDYGRWCFELNSWHMNDQCRPFDIDTDEESPGVPSASSADKPSVAHTWEKRPRVGVIPDFQTATNGRKSALESKLRKFGDRKSDAVVAPVPGMEFDSLPEAFDFYNLYSWEVGFGIRYGTSRRNKAKSLTMQEILCGCAGSPRHDKTKSVACGCQAMIRLK